MKKIAIFMGLVLLAKTSLAGELVRDAIITSVGSTNWNEKVFFVILSGGVGVCADTGVNFPEEYSQSPMAYAMSHGMAMQAYIHKKKVRIHNYGDKTFRGDNVCTGASYIQLYD